MTITDKMLEEERKASAKMARSAIGMKLHGLIVTFQAAVMRSVVRGGIVWIDKSGTIRKERRSK